jgi:hypothetical protein
MSYFDSYFNVDGVRTLRTYTRPLPLVRFDRAGWMWSEAGADRIEEKLLGLRRIPLVTPAMAAILETVDPLSYQAGTLVTNPEGLYKPRTSAHGS